MDIISDSSETNIPVQNFSEYYTSGDIAYFCITDIIKSIPTKAFILTEEEENGFWYCWKFMRERQSIELNFNTMSTMVQREQKQSSLGKGYQTTKSRRELEV